MRVPSTIKIKSLLQRVFLLFVLSLVPVFLGGTVALFGPPIGVFWCILLAVLLGYLIFRNTGDEYSGVFFIIGFYLYFLLPFLAKLTQVNFAGLWQLLLLFSIFGFAKFYDFLKDSNVAKFAMVFFFSFLAIALICTFTGRSHFPGAFYQFLSDLKPILIIVVGFAITWNDKLESYFWNFFDWYWLPALALIVFEWFLPSVYDTVFYTYEQSREALYVPTRAVGPFLHSSYFAASGAMFSLMIFSRMLISGIDRKFDWVRLAVYIGIVISTVQRQELVALIASIGLIYIIARSEKVLIRSLIACCMLFVGLTVFWLVFGDKLKIEIAQMGVGTFGSIENARVQIYQSAIYLAKEYFPLGTGLGTYGGAGADKFDHSVYFEMGFTRYWWFRRENFLMDTYWPNSIAETGVFGMLMLLMTYLLLLWHAIKRSLKTMSMTRVYWSYAAAGIFYLLILSASSPAFQDPMLSFLPLVIFGLAHTREKYQVPAK